MIWIEILGRHREVVARHRCEAAEVRIGRGYDNDVVVDDPYVAPSQLRVYRGDDGTLIAENLGSAGGLLADDGHPHPRVVVDGNHPLRIGRTLLRIRDASYAVAPERVAAPTARMWPWAIGLAAGIATLEILSLWLGETAEPKISRYVLPPAILAVLTLLWTSAWAVLNRIFAGYSHFERHLVITLTALLVFALFEELVDIGAFALSWRLLADYSYIGAWAVFATLCFFHLREIGPTRLRLKAGIVFGLGAAVVAAQALAQAEIRPWMSRQSYLRDLKPPFLRVAAPRDDEAFFADAERLKAKLDRARKEESPGGGLPGLDLDD